MPEDPAGIKRAARARMAETGEKYMRARQAVLAERAASPRPPRPPATEDLAAAEIAGAFRRQLLGPLLPDPRAADETIRP